MKPESISKNSSTNLSQQNTCDAKPAGQTRKLFGFAIKLVVGISLLAFLFFHYDLHSVLHILSRERPITFVAAVVLFLGSQFLSVFRWQLLAELNGLGGR